MTSLTADGTGGSASIMTLGRADEAAGVAAPARVTEFPTLKGTASARVQPASGHVPFSAFVIVGSAVSRRPTTLATANDNSRAGTGRARSVWRDLFFLTLLAVTIVGAFWSGKLNATQRVIVVPGPSSDRHVVT